MDIVCWVWGRHSTKRKQSHSLNVCAELHTSFRTHRSKWQLEDSPLLELQDERTFIHLDWVELASRETNWTPLSAHENTWQRKDLLFAWFFAYTNKNNSSTSCQDCILGGPAPDACVSSITVAAPRAVLMQPWSEIGWKPGTEPFCFNVSTPGEEWTALQGSVALPYFRHLVTDRIQTIPKPQSLLSTVLLPKAAIYQGPSVPLCPPLSPFVPLYLHHMLYLDPK